MNMYDRIQELCIMKGITIAELERKADLGNGTIRRWKESYPSLDKAFRVAEVLNVSTDYLYKGTKNTDAAAVARKFDSLSDDELRTINDMIDFYLLRKEREKNRKK